MSNLLKDASWLMIPQGIKEDIVFTQKPVDGSGNLTFTRASDATRTNSAGVIERTPWNLVQFSEQFNNALWGKIGDSTVTADQAIAPNGTLTADLITEGTSTLVYFVNTFPAGTYTQSYYAKKGTGDIFGMYFGGGFSARFNLTNGTVVSTNNTTATITNVGNGWYRCTATATPTANFFAGISYANSPGLTIYAWGAQLVEGTDAKPYFATTNRQDVPRLDYRNADGSLSTCPRLLLEPQRTNSIRNSSMVGAVAGTPGTLPTNWQVPTSAGLTQTVVGIGTQNGLPYIDLRFNGTANATELLVTQEGGNFIAASSGQTWSSAIYARTIAAPSAPNTTNLRVAEITTLGVIVARQLTPVTLTSTLQRFTSTRTLNGGATVAFANGGLVFELTNGAAYDFTIRIAAPQMELGTYASTFIPTTTAAVTRLVDASSLGNIYTNGLLTASGGTWFIDLNDTSERIRAASVGLTLSVSGTDYIEIRNTSTALTRPTIRFIVASTSTGGFTLTANNSKIAINWNGTFGNIFVNGVKVISNASFTPLALQTLSLTGAGVATFINQSAFFPVPMTDAQCIQMTT